MRLGALSPQAEPAGAGATIAGNPRANGVGSVRVRCRSTCAAALEGCDGSDADPGCLQRVRVHAHAPPAGAASAPLRVLLSASFCVVFVCTVLFFMFVGRSLCCAIFCFSAQVSLCDLWFLFWFSFTEQVVLSILCCLGFLFLFLCLLWCLCFFLFLSVRFAI